MRLLAPVVVVMVTRATGGDLTEPLRRRTVSDRETCPLSTSSTASTCPSMGREMDLYTLRIFNAPSMYRVTPNRGGVPFHGASERASCVSTGSPRYSSGGLGFSYYDQDWGVSPN